MAWREDEKTGKYYNNNNAAVPSEKQGAGDSKQQAQVAAWLRGQMASRQPTDNYGKRAGSSGWGHSQGCYSQGNFGQGQVAEERQTVSGGRAGEDTDGSKSD